jgi:hypothetical protein
VKYKHLGYLCVIGRVISAMVRIDDVLLYCAQSNRQPMTPYVHLDKLPYSATIWPMGYCDPGQSIVKIVGGCFTKGLRWLANIILLLLSTKIASK